MKRLTEHYLLDCPDSDGEFFFFPGRLVTCGSMLQALRDSYAYVKLTHRLSRRLNELGWIRRTYVLCRGQPPLDWYFCKSSILSRRCRLRRDVMALKRRLATLEPRNIFKVR